MRRARRIGILTSGGDCPGINAVIRAVTKSALSQGMEVVGIRDGFLGLIDGSVLPLTDEVVAGILTQGGTILGTTNRANPFRLAVEVEGKRVWRPSRPCVETKCGKLSGRDPGQQEVGIQNCLKLACAAVTC